MSNVTSLRMRVLPRFPARITADKGLTIERDGLDLVLKPDFGSLMKVPSVQGAEVTYFWTWNEQHDAYSTISFQNLVANIQGRDHWREPCRPGCRRIWPEPRPDLR